MDGNFFDKPSEYLWPVYSEQIASPKTDGAGAPVELRNDSLATWAKHEEKPQFHIVLRVGAHACRGEMQLYIRARGPAYTWRPWSAGTSHVIRLFCRDSFGSLRKPGVAR